MNNVIIVTADLFRHKEVDGVKIITPYKHQTNSIFNAIRKFLTKIHLGRIFINKKELLGFSGTIILFDAIDKQFVDWLGKNKKNNRIIFWYWNPADKSFDYKNIPASFEVWSYSKSDCSKYGFKWNSQFLLNNYMPEITDNSSFDVSFIGRRKGREKELYEFREIVEKAGHTFYIYLTKKKKYDFKNKDLPTPLLYDDYLREENKGKVFFDLGQSKEVGMTLRSLEAIYYKKKIICNYDEIQNSFISDKNVFYYSNIKSIDINKLKQFLKSPFVDDNNLTFYYFENWLKRFFIEQE